MGGLLTLALLLSLSSCKSPLTSFVCEENSDCARDGIGSRCEIDRRCSFEDDDCESGYRYGSESGPVSSQCSPPDSGAADASILGPIDGSVPIPDASEGGDTIIAMSVGRAHGCVLLGQGVTRCWGDNSTGQLNGIPDNIPHGEYLERGPLQLTNPAGVEACGGTTCVFGTRGIDCFGDDSSAQLSTGFQEISGITAIAGGNLSSSSLCSLRNTEDIACWGGNSDGQASGDGQESEPIRTPTDIISSGDQDNAIAVGGNHACAIRAGEILCWGDNRQSQMALPAGNNNLPVTAIPIPGNPREIASGDNHSCIIEGKGEVYCWGSNNRRQASFNAVPIVGAPTRLGNGRPAVSLALGASHSCLLGNDAKVYCWGDNSFGQLGSPQSESGNPVLNLSNVVSIAAGQDHTCALVRNDPVQVNGVYCWGRNDRMQLGNLGGDFSFMPVLSYEEN